MASETKSKFDEMTVQDVADKVATGEYADDPEEGQGFVPAVVYTQGQNLDLNRMNIPLLRIAQGTTEEVKDRKASVGQFVLTNFAPEDDVLLVPLAAQNIRRYSPDPQAPPKCVAPTGVHGIGEPGILCASCKLAQWGPRDPKTGKSAKPACTEGVSVRCYSVTHRSLVDFRFMAGNIQGGQFIQQQGMAWGLGNFAIRMGSKLINNTRGNSWFVPTLEMVKDIEPDQAEVAQNYFKAMQEALPTAEEAARQLMTGPNGG